MVFKLWWSLPSGLFCCSAEKHIFAVVPSALDASFAFSRCLETVSPVASELPPCSSLTLFVVYFTPLSSFLITESL